PRARRGRGKTAHGAPRAGILASGRAACAKQDRHRIGSAMSIDLDIQQRIAVVTINRPGSMNALDQEHYGALSNAWIEIRDNADIWAAVVTGAGDRAFCAGADLKEFIPKPPTASEMWMTQKDQLLNRGLEVWKPIVAAVNGWCVGGGM